MKDEKNPYKVPEGYFEDVKSRILARTVQSGVPHKPVQAEEQEETTVYDFVPRKKNTLPVRWRNLAGLAAAFVLLVGLGSVLFNIAERSTMAEGEEMLTADITAEEHVLWEANVIDIYDMLEEDDDMLLLAMEAEDYVDDWGMGGLGDINLEIFEDEEVVTE